MTHFLSTVVFAILVAIVGCAEQDVASPQKTLRWKFQPGMKYHVLVTKSTDQDIKGSADQIRVISQLLIDAEYCVESVDDNGTAQIALSYKRMRIKIQSPDGNIDIDTATADDKLPKDSVTQHKILKEVVPNLRFWISVNNRGEILTVESDAALFQPLDRIFPGISERVSAKEARRTLRCIFQVLPEASLAVNDTWSNTLEITLPGLSAFQMAHVRYRYVGSSLYKNARLEKIITEATLEWGETPAGVSAKIVSQENPGTIYFDGDTGRLVEYKNFQRMTSNYTTNSGFAREQLTVTSKVEINPVTSDIP